MTSNHIFTSSPTSTIKSIDVSDPANLSVSDTSYSLKERIINVNQFLYACDKSPGIAQSAITQIDVTDPTNMVFKQYIYCSYGSYGSGADEVLPVYPVYYDKWVLIAGSKLKVPPPQPSEAWAVLWAIDVTDPSNPVVTSYEVAHAYISARYDTYICLLGDILIYCYGAVKAYDLTNLPTSIDLQDTWNQAGVISNVNGIVGDTPNFYITDVGKGAIHSFSYTVVDGITYLDTLTLAVS